MDFPCPLGLTITPVVHLARVAVEGDALMALELQVYDDPVHGRGASVRLTWDDGTVDLLLTPELRPSAADLAAEEQEGARVEVDDELTWRWRTRDGAVDVAVDLVDRHGEAISWRLREEAPTGADLSMLAPAGDAVARPRALPIRWLHAVRLVPQRCHVTVHRGGTPLLVRRTALPVRGERRWWAHVATEVLCARVAPSLPGVHPCPRVTVDGPGTVRDGPRWWTFVEGDRGLALAELGTEGDGHRVVMRLRPALPPLDRLDRGETWVGRAELGPGAAPEALQAEVTALRTRHGATLLVQPDRNWWPEAVRDWMALVAYPAAWRRWARTWRWRASIRFEAAGATLEAAWERTPPARIGDFGHTVRVDRVVPVPIEHLWRAFTDLDEILRTPGVTHVELLEPGDPEPEGRGSRRMVALVTGRYVEEITEWSPPHRFAYRIREAEAPIDHAHGHVELEAVEGGTRVDWVSVFRVDMPLFGGMVGEWAERKMGRDLGRHLDVIVEGWEE